MPKIDVTDETYTEIFTNVFAEDYRMACQSIRELLTTVDIKPYQQEDLDYYINLRKAMEVVLFYYFPAWEAESMIQNQKVLDKYSDSE